MAELEGQDEALLAEIVAAARGAGKAGPREQGFIGRSVAGKFVIEGFIGSGAMGAVYRARQTALDKVVAVKVLHRELAKDQTFPVRFMREAKAASRIDHPNSMRVLDFGEESDGTLYMAMEFLDGRDLFQVIKSEWPLSVERIADVLMQTLAALAVAHEMGVVHRDLKPENIMVLTAPDDEGGTRDHVKVCDFGIAKIIDKRSEVVENEGPKLTTQGLVVGTPEYMAPEQGRGEPLDARADLYSVGIILYHLLVGALPFEAESALGIVLKHVTDEPVPPSKRARDPVDPRLEAICLKAIRKAPADRYQSAREMRADLRAVLQGASAPVSSLYSEGPRSGVANSPAQLATAATEVSLDSAAVRTAAARPVVDRAASHATPLGTNIEGLAGPVRGRWTGHIVAVGLLCAVLAGAGVIVKSRMSAAAPDGSADGVPSAAAVGSNATGEGKLPEPPPSSAATPPVASAVIPAGTGTSSGAAHSSGRGQSKGPHGSSTDTPPPEVAPNASAVASSPSASVAPASSTEARPPVEGAGAIPPPQPSASVAPENAPPPFDPSRAKVTIGVVHATGASLVAVRGELDAQRFSDCYRAGLQGVAAKPPVSKMTLHLVTDEGGLVESATLRGAPPVPAKTVQCVTQAMVGKSLHPDGESGVVSADVDLTFSPE